MVVAYILCPATEMPASYQLPVGEHQIQIGSGEQNSGDQAPEPGLVFILDVLVDPGCFVADWREGVRVLPLPGWPL